jgi:hypothetical protein
MKKVMMTITMATCLLAAGCLKDRTSNLSDEESRIYITNKAAGTNFGRFVTFAVRDSVFNVDGDDLSYQLNDVDRAFISTVISNMKARGYVEVAPSPGPDFGFL